MLGEKDFRRIRKIVRDEITSAEAKLSDRAEKQLIAVLGIAFKKAAEESLRGHANAMPFFVELLNRLFCELRKQNEFINMLGPMNHTLSEIAKGQRPKPPGPDDWWYKGGNPPWDVSDDDDEDDAD